jgi:hypothetical protein
MKEQLEKVIELTLSKDKKDKDIAQQMIRILVRDTRPVPTDFFQKGKRYMFYKVGSKWFFDCDKGVLLFAEEI